MFIKNCPTCGKEIVYKSIHGLKRSIEKNFNCRSCIAKKDGYNESLEVTCDSCGKTKTYSNKYNAHGARENKSCSSCSRSKANKKLWADPDFRKRRGEAASERWRVFWKNPKNKEAHSLRTSKMNIENWKKDEYRDRMINNLLPNRKKYGYCKTGYYKGHYFRSSKELKFMIKLDKEGKSWSSCENSEYAIRYSYKGKVYTYYPDFRVENEIVEIKSKNQFNDEIVLAKKEAAESWCKERGLTYKLHDPGSLSSLVIARLREEKVILLLE